MSLTDPWRTRGSGTPIPDLPADRPVRFGLVGVGRVARNHLRAFEALPDATLVAACDARPDRLDAASLPGSIQRYTNLADMLRDAELDVVSICTPSGLHPAQVRQVAAAGRHVVTEKPMATRWADGLRMVEACDDAGVRMFVVKQNRLNPTIQLVKSAVDARRFGRIHMVHVNVFWTRPQAYYDADAWRGTWEFDGGAFMNQASHYVDLLDWLVGPVSSVQAMMSTRGRNIEVEDTGVLNIEWRSGTLGSMAVTMLAYPKNIEGSLTILGETGSVRIGGVAVNRIDHWEFETPHPDDERVESANYETESVYGHGHTPYYANVIACLRGQRHADTDGREGLRSLELLIAAYMAARDRRQVSLPLAY